MTVYVPIVEFDIHMQCICLRFRLPCVGVSYSILIPEKFIHFYFVVFLRAFLTRPVNFSGPLSFRVCLVIVSARETFYDLYTTIHSSQSDGLLENI